MQCEKYVTAHEHFEVVCHILQSSSNVSQNKF